MILEDKSFSFSACVPSVFNCRNDTMPITKKMRSMDEEVFDQDLYFKRYEIMTRFLSKQYPDLEETFLDHLVEELYGKLFEENTK